MISIEIIYPPMISIMKFVKPWQSCKKVGVLVSDAEV